MTDTPKSDTSPTDTTTHFGFSTVPEGQKEHLVRGVFDSVARNYDVMNDLMSGGLHRIWKRAMVAKLDPKPGWHTLDVAGGTGDIAFRILNATDHKAHVTVCDINAEMIAVGRDRALDSGMAQGLDWTVGNAENLPFEDNTFDAWTCAFGVRNMTHIDRALSEAFRVLKPGGRFLCLEFSQVTSPVLSRVYDTYSFQILPRMGQVVARDRDSYQYLAESIRKFPKAPKYAEMIEAAGFKLVRFQRMTGGIVALHSGFKV